MRGRIWAAAAALLLLSACGEGREAAGYRVNVAPADTMGEWVTAWLEELEPGDGFQSFVYSDPDFWDVYLYYPEEQAAVQTLTEEDVRLEIRDSLLYVYASPGEPADPPAEEPWVIHIAAPFRGPWPTGAVLYWEVPCDDTHWNI